MRMVTPWGRLQDEPHHVVSLNNPEQARQQITQSALPAIAHGMGRSYGDVALNAGHTLWATTELDHFIAFDEATGCLTCEAGVLLRDIQQTLLPRGWLLPVTPGTQMVTVGGAIANDIHGKNHHVTGSFGHHVHWIELLRTDSDVIQCGPQNNPEWFAATVGGLGLTGLITRVEIQLRRVAGPWLDTETIPFTGLDSFFELADDSEADWEHTVAWVDCLSGQTSRGLFMRANHSETPHPELKQPAKTRRTMPFVPPMSLVNRLTLRPFNLAYYHRNKRRAGQALTHYEPYFYPLDGLHHWNRMYGPKGFYQYQSVVPRHGGQQATQAMLDAITASGEGSFLAVLKTFGNHQSPGLLSFPQPGVTLALDFPNRGARTHRLLDRLDAIVREAGGRIYPAKDARMSRDLFESGYPQLPTFQKYRDPGISSQFARRLMGH